MNELSNKDFEYDFDYIIKFLKENSPYAHMINFKKIEEYKDLVCNVDNIAEFFYRINRLYRKILNPKKTGHNFFWLYNKDFMMINKKCYHYDFFTKYKNILYNENDYVNSKFYKELQKNKINETNNKTKNETKNKIKEETKKEKIYDCRIIKDNKNNDCIYIKIKVMIDPNEKEYNELKNFLIKNKKLENIYIDIRGNSGGNSYCWVRLFQLIYNKKLKFYHNNVKIYLKYTKYNKLWFNKNLNCYELNKSSNKNFTHYIIQKLNENNMFINNDYYIGFKGNIYIIMDKSNFSSAQLLLDYVKGNEGITLLGNEKSSGSGLYGSVTCCGNVDNFYFMLPKTKILFMYEKYYYNHTKYLTEPDKPIPKFLMKKEFLI